MEKPAPPETAPTNPGVQTARQLAEPIVEMLKAWLPRAILQSANGLPVEELNIGAAIEAAITARDRQHEAALTEAREMGMNMATAAAQAVMDRDKASTKLSQEQDRVVKLVGAINEALDKRDTARARLGEAVGLLREWTELSSKKPDILQRTFEFVEALAFPESAAPPKETT